MIDNSDRVCRGAEGREKVGRKRGERGREKVEREKGENGGGRGRLRAVAICQKYNIHPSNTI